VIEDVTLMLCRCQPVAVSDAYPPASQEERNLPE
jgi:hypothetical protein